jgi:hypothetical protein
MSEDKLKKWNDYFENSGYELVKKQEIPEIPMQEVVSQPFKQLEQFQEEPEKKKEKKKKKPNLWDRIFKKQKLKKPESVAVLYLRKNGVAQPLYIEPKNEMFHIGTKVYHQRKDCKYLITKDKVPLAIIFEEGLVPVGNKEFYDLDVQRRCAEHQDHAIKAIRHAEIVRMGYDDKDKKKINPKVVIGIIIIAIVGYALLKGGLVG